MLRHGRFETGVQRLGKPFRLAELVAKRRDVLDSPSGPGATKD